MNGDNLNSILLKASRYFRNTRREYLKGKINQFQANSKHKNIRDLCRGINYFEEGLSKQN
jgi:hypothetical protein